ncbi:hypothetical protein AUEXF2481DRAFT_455942 [Aureobasidium subglaciale EXF-2481]|uniref:Uncharacterized protein n=1 Tax=Aureobasidium subglaciale (strain EXF-2481) TaxID=1043005 RepID=A0A074Y6U6_AURSE|nr:uncharacterized protein AUEXF2481DRAFT_455942 [Aureobasidium subglaciale EXF-2481]KEQ91644.1 hypothetical protein AUEXF2481DRAFT_455942 [Aureobasidium subglaciale EXF-2481]
MMACDAATRHWRLSRGVCFGLSRAVSFESFVSFVLESCGLHSSLTTSKSHKDNHRSHTASRQRVYRSFHHHFSLASSLLSHPVSTPKSVPNVNKMDEETSNMLAEAMAAGDRVYSMRVNAVFYSKYAQCTLWSLPDPLDGPSRAPCYAPFGQAAPPPITTCDGPAPVSEPETVQTVGPFSSDVHKPWERGSKLDKKTRKLDFGRSKIRAPSTKNKGSSQIGTEQFDTRVKQGSPLGSSNKVKKRASGKRRPKTLNVGVEQRSTHDGLSNVSSESNGNELSSSAPSTDMSSAGSHESTTQASEVSEQSDVVIKPLCQVPEKKPRSFRLLLPRPPSGSDTSNYHASQLSQIAPKVPASQLRYTYDTPTNYTKVYHKILPAVALNRDGNQLPSVARPDSRNIAYNSSNAQRYDPGISTDDNSSSVQYQNVPANSVHDHPGSLHMERQMPEPAPSTAQAAIAQMRKNSRGLTRIDGPSY